MTLHIAPPDQTVRPLMETLPLTARLDDELCIAGIAELQDDLLGLLNHAHVLLDLRAIPGWDACGVQFLLILWQEFQRRRGTLTLLADDPPLRQSLRWLGLPAQALVGSDEEAP
ncbi:STAS domain-containing protein [Roseateles koreensis]|uniref:STAS domain-containing protein n=1 Tax=Roseateles koreensis TaxID=2987526 RepID=A0ABT5KUS2_9BURK|nr:STAS domain-containing protein [Roseateles koreensis]MDC8785571.1 STAS domain-containing protein [Roseateles koreensis]